MKHIRAIALMMMGLSVSACASVDTATRNAPLEAQSRQQMAAAPLDVKIVGYNIVAPENLRVSEANMYYPLGDVVWREDAPGNRLRQIEAIFKTAFERGTEQVKGSVPVVAQIEIKRFHALTEKARYTIGGVHSLKFIMTLTDPATGAVVAPARLIEADLEAYGGAKAIYHENHGITQKVRITEHLAKVFQKELTDPTRPEPAKTAAIQN